MEPIKVTLISGRTAKQGIGLEEGKLSTNYTESVNHVQISPNEAKTLSLKEDEKIKISTEYGTVVVNWKEDKQLDSGMVFFPYGPWANQVYSAYTGSTGMPIMKGIDAEIEKTSEKPLSLGELVKKIKEGA